jgi:metal-dependent HD superfamily phosphatase/phosphodiesterase
MRGVESACVVRITFGIILAASYILHALIVHVTKLPALKTEAGLSSVPDRLTAER